MTVSKIKAQAYKNGKAVKPVPTVKFNGKTLKKGTDYSLTYKNNKKKSKKAQVIITGKGTNFNNKKVVYFTIK